MLMLDVAIIVLFEDIDASAPKVNAQKITVLS
jgi:hypothetical protein